MGKNPIKDVIRNDSLTLTATVTDPNNNNLPISLDGWKAYCTVKSDLNLASNENDDVIALAQIVVDPISDPLGTGTVDFTFTPADANITPGKLFYDVEIITATGQVYSSPEDKFIVNADITRATS